MPDPHAAAVIEVDDLRGAAEPEHVRCAHAVVCRQRGDVALPPDLRTDTELAAMKQDHRIALSRFEIAREKAVDPDGVAGEIGHAVSQAVRANVRSWVASRSS